MELRMLTRNPNVPIGQPDEETARRFPVRGVSTPRPVEHRTEECEKCAFEYTPRFNPCGCPVCGHNPREA
jgi:hypothetical protein